MALLALEELADAALAGRAGKDALVGFATSYRDYASGPPAQDSTR